MSQPPAYARAFSFTDWTTNHPDDQQPGVSLDNEFEAIETTTNAIRTNLALIQRDDGALANNSVGPDQLANDITIGLRSVSDWAASTAYIALDAVWHANKLYRCEESHDSSGAFATDLADGLWTLLVDMEPYAEDAAADAVSAEVIQQLSADPDLTVLLNGKADKAGSNTFSGNNNVFSGSGNTFNQVVSLLGGFSCSIGTATSQQDYWKAQPTDYAVGKPRVVLRKTTTAGLWDLIVEDNTGAIGVLNLRAGTVQANGSALWHAGNFDPTLKLNVADLPSIPTTAQIRRIATRRALVF